MAGNGAESEIPTEGTSHGVNPEEANNEDDSDWLRTLAMHVKETRTDILNLQYHFLETEQVLIILNFLDGSKFSELNLSNNHLTNGVAHLAPFLITMEIRKLDISSCHLTKEDLLQLAEVLSDSEITDLVLVEPKAEKFDSNDAHKFISLLQKSKLTALNFDYFNFCPQSDITSLFQEFLKLPVTSLNFQPGLLDSNGCISLFAKLSHSSVTDLDVSGIDISDEAFRALCQRLRETKIEKLNLRRSDLKVDHFSTLIDGLVGSKVTDLDIGQNRFSSLDPLFVRLKETQIRTLSLDVTWNSTSELLTYPNSLQWSSLVSLDLNSNKLSDAAGAILMENLRFSSVETLVVCENFLGILTIRKFTENLKDINITCLDISRNSLLYDALLLLGQHLKQSRLTCVKINNLRYHSNKPAGPEIEASHLLSFLKLTEGSSVCRIDMGHYWSPIWDHPSLCEQKLLVTELHLNNCRIKDNVSNLISYLKHSGTTRLNLAQNFITDDGAAVIAECLKETQIRRLDLSWNLITDEGAKSLAFSLKESNLVSLNLTLNRIEVDGFKALAEHAKDMFISVLDAGCSPEDMVLYFNQILWQNNVTIQKLVSIYKEIAPETNDAEFQFDRNSDDFDVSALLEKCFWFHATIVNNPRAINVLLEEKSVSFSREEMSQLVFVEFPRQLSAFIACRIEADLTERVRILERAEELECVAIVQFLLIHRPVFMLDEKQGILHPHVYKLLIKYKQPICNVAVEPHGITKIIDYFTEHSDMEGAQDVVQALCNANIL